MAREADRKRGWGKFCSKSCKAIRQMQTHGDTREYQPGVSWEQFREDRREYGGIPEYDRRGCFVGIRMSTADLAYGGYNNAGPEDGFGDGKW